ncbi:RHS repeat-associated core domain-containing protein [Saccharomonospora sp. NPDC046836]|uniref:RHS repeat-associated core domain-containing protein n=1 Tax=Saccharomonospora sp. NPDC046836 TaxID=3156921 RepID=UPI003408D7A2
MAGYADVEDPIGLLAQDPGLEGGSSIEDAIADAGLQVQVVNWVWEKVVGEDLVSSIITPITGDFESIAKAAAQWSNVRDALQAVRNNLNGGLEELRPGWSGDAAEQFYGLIGTTWTIGLEADAQAARLIGIALGKVADGSKAACDRILDLIEKLVNKLIEAAAMLPIPVVGWGRAVKLVYDAIQFYNAIMSLIQAIQSIIEGAQQVIQGITEVGTALSQLGSANSLNDVINAGNTAASGVGNIRDGASSVRDGVTEASSAVSDARTTASSATDNARGLADERTNTRTDPGTTTSSNTDSTSTGPDSRNPTSRQQDGSLRSDAQNPVDRSQQPIGRCGRREPIDMATGEMFLVQKDVELPGVLELVLERVHVSSYRAGRSFGRSWAATVDQRLEIVGDQVYYAGSDGVILVYPQPHEGDEVFAAVGARWPLSRDEDGYVVTQPETGRTLRFEPSRDGVCTLSAITDRNDNRIDFEYAPNGSLTQIRHSCGYNIAVDIAQRRITGLRLNNNAGRDVTLVQYRYSQAGDLTEVFNSSGRALQFDYDSHGRIVKWQDRNGEWYGYQYDQNGRCVRTEGSGNALAGTIEYDTSTRVTRETNSLGDVSVYNFNELNQLVRQIDPIGNETHYEWDRYGRLLAEVDALHRTTRNRYDEQGNLVEIVRPDGSQIAIAYNELNLLTSLVTPDGATRRQSYDARGNLIESTDEQGAVTTFEYAEFGHLRSVTDAMSGVRRIETDAAGLPVVVTEPGGGVTRYRRDVFGRLAERTAPNGHLTRYSWTVEGKPLSRVLPDGTVDRWRYDAEGNQVEHVNGIGHLTRTSTTHFDLPAEEIGADGGRTRYEYDTELRLRSVTNPGGLRWLYEYDAAGRLIKEVDFNGVSTQYHRDAAGQLVEKTNGQGQTISFERDALGNIVRQVSGQAVTTFEYDAAGRLTRATNSDADLTLQRDACGRVVAETINGRTVSSAYDLLGRRTVRQTPSGTVADWDYDADGRPISMRTAGRTLTFSYDADGHEVQRQLDQTSILGQEWDPNGRLASQTVFRPAAANASTALGHAVQQRSYSYRADGHITAVADRFGGSRDFIMDRLGRPTAVRRKLGAELYEYDATGNIRVAAWPGSDTSPQGARTYQGTLISEAGLYRYGHDRQGRMVTRVLLNQRSDQRGWAFNWDAEDRLLSVLTPDGSQWRYLYDALGRRIAKQRWSSDGIQCIEQTDFAWDGKTIAEESQSTGRVITWEFRPGGHNLLTQYERAASDDGEQSRIDETFYSIVTDLIGAPTELVSPQGEVHRCGETTLWGFPLTNEQARTPWRFPGQYHDPETGWHYNYFRYYQPETARYGATDPLGLAGGPNPHAYVPNPLSWIDPLGLAATRECGPGDDSPVGTVVNERGIRILIHSNDHPPPHAHVQGGGTETRIGQNGHPLEGDPELTRRQREVVENNRNEIRDAIGRYMRWHRNNG